MNTKSFPTNLIFRVLVGIVIIATIGLWIMIAAQMTWSTSMIATSVLHGLGLLLLLFRPKAASALIIITFATTCILPDAYSTVQLLGFEFALIYSGATFKPWNSLLCLFISIAGIWSSFALHFDTALNCLSNSTLYLFTYIAGLLFGLFRLQAANKEKELHMQALAEKANFAQRNASLAKALHDSVTAELTSIAILSNNAAMEPRGYDLSDTLHTINAQADKALNDIHESIRTLLSDGNPDKATQHKTVQSIVQEGDQYLHHLGFKGDSVVFPHDSTLELSDAVADMFKELYSNIARHCAPRVDEYSLCVMVDEQSLRIIQSNTVSGNQTHTFHSGYGLGMLRRAVASMNGTLTTTYDDAEWTATIRLPLSRLQNHVM